MTSDSSLKVGLFPLDWKKTSIPVNHKDEKDILKKLKTNVSVSY